MLRLSGHPEARRKRKKNGQCLRQGITRKRKKTWRMGPQQLALTERVRTPHLGILRKRIENVSNMIKKRWGWAATPPRANASCDLHVLTSTVLRPWARVCICELIYIGQMYHVACMFSLLWSGSSAIGTDGKGPSTPSRHPTKMYRKRIENDKKTLRLSGHPEAWRKRNKTVNACVKA